MSDLESFKNKLLTLKKEFSHRVDAIDKDSRHEGMTADWSEQATERENDEVLYSLGVASEIELNMINSALKRIEDDTYFTCTECGSDIPPERLELVPYISTCVACAEKNEHI